MKTPRSTFVLIFVTIFLDMMGLGILVPAFPMLIAPHSAFRIIPEAWTVSQGFILGGWLMASYSIMQFFFAPVLGQLSDRYGRKKILALSIFGTSISHAIFAYGIITHNIILLFVARMVDGISGGNITVAQAVIGDISKPADRAKHFGMIGIALGLGFILGPFIGGKLSDASLVSWFTITTPFLFASILSLCNMGMMLVLLPETLQSPRTAPLELRRALLNVTKGFSLPELRGIIPALFLFNAGFTLYTTFLGVVLAEDFLFTPVHIGNYFGFMGIMMVLAQGGLVRRLSGKVSEIKVLHWSMLGTGLVLIPMFFIPGQHVAWIYLLPPFIAAGMALTRAFSMSLLTQIAGPERRGEVMGINSSSYAMAQAIPAVLAGYIAAQHARLPILVGALVCLLGWGLFSVLFQPKTMP